VCVCCEGSFRISTPSNVVVQNAVDTPNGDLVVSPGDELRISWSPSLLFPNIDPNNLRVDIVLSQFHLTNSALNGNRTLALAYLSRNIANDGETSVTFPSIPSVSGQIAAVSIQVVLSQSQNSNLAGALQQAKLWSRLFYYSPTESNYLGNCQLWVDRQQNSIGEMIMDRVVPCPPLLFQANAINSGLRRDTTSMVSRRFFHGENSACFRGTDFLSGLVGASSLCSYTWM